MSATPEAEQELINRREAIRHVSVLLGGVALVGGSDLLAALEKPVSKVHGSLGDFTAQDIALLDEIAETILPETKTPGAKAARTGAFMARMVTDCYSPAQQKVFREGMRKVDDAGKNTHGVAFMAATPAQRLAVLTTLDQEQKRVMDARAAAAAGVAASSTQEPEPAHFFRMMKELALLGYFTSEIGCTKALRYVEAPGRFDPCIPYTPGESAWAQHA